MIKQYFKLRFLILPIICMAFVGVLPRFSFALSGITLNVDPEHATIGDVVRLFGVNASSYGEVRIYLSSTMFLASTEADEVGSYSINLTIPSLRSNTYDVMALDVSTGDTSLVKLSIQPRITLTPNAGPYRDSITVRGEGFQFFTPITITFNESDVTPSPQPLPDGFGVFEADFQVPLMPNGSYVVMASDGVVNATATFTVLPKISLSPQTSGAAGTFVMVIGSGFSPSVNLTVKFDTFDVTNYGGMETWKDGSFGIWMVLPAMFYVPDVQDGVYVVNATDETGISATAPFIVPSPTLMVNPNVTSGSSRVTVSGSGFAPREPILIYFEDTLMVNLLDLMVGSQVLYADEFGVYEYSFIVPVTKPGVYSITAYRLADSIDFTVGDKLAATSLTIVEDAMLTEVQAELISLNGTLATINSTLGLIEVETSSIGLDVIEINGSVATIYTTLSTIEGRITSIDGNTVTIVTDIGTVKARIDSIEGDLGTINEPQEAVLTPLYIVAILSLIAAVGTTILTIMHVRVLRRSES